MKTKVKLMTALLAAIMIVMLLPAVAQAETYEVGNAESFASALDSLEDGDTIKLAADINYTVSTGFAAINVSGKSITFDVGDYTLNVVHTSATALGVDSNGKVELVCGAGEFNVTGLNYGVYASEGEATVTSATGTGDSSSGAYATGAGSKITVTGLAQGVQNGAYAGSGGTVIAGSAAGTGKNGIHASGVGSSITVSGAVDGIENGIYATGGATVVAGSASSTGPTSYGVNVFDAATMVTVNGAVTGLIRAVAVNGGTAVVGSAAATGTGNIGVYATSSGTVTVNGNATGNFAVQAENGATVTVNGDAQGVERGVFAQSGASVTVSNAIATGDIGRGAYAAGGGTITVNGNAAGKAYGAMAEGTSSNIIVSGTARGESTAGVLAKDGGAVEAGAAEGATYGASTSGANSRITVSGAAQGGAYGVYANGGTISAGSATATEAGGQGVLADGGAVEINGDVNGADRGVWAINNSTVAIDGAVQGVSYGVYADESTIEVNGDITATGVNGTGADARNGSLITIKGDITAPYYIIVNGNIKTPEQGVPGAGDDDGYLVYGAGADKVRVKAITAVITITGQPASTLNLTEGAISATLTCAAEVSPAGTPSYLWYRCDNPAKANPVSTGVNTATFTIPAGLTQGTYYYFCRVSAAGAVDVDSNVSTIVVVKTVSSDASLSGLSVSSGTLVPAFSSAHCNYTVTVPNNVSSITVTPTTSHAAAAVAVNGTAVDSGSASDPIDLTTGENTITVVVTAEDETQKTYTIVVTRAEPGYLPRTLIDSATGISISGNAIHQDAVLTVGTLDLHPSAACAACKAIRQRLDDDDYTLVLGRNISLSHGFSGTITVTIPVGDQYNGKTLTVLHCDEGVLKEFKCKVENGAISFTANSLSPVAVLRYSPRPDGSLPATGDRFVFLKWVVLISLAGIAMLSALLLKKRRKQQAE